MPTVNRAEASKGHPAPVITVSPVVRCVRLVVLAQGLSQFDATHFKGREKRPEIPDSVLDLNLPHRASL